jgi:UDP-N-acetylmuramoyl-L-alanyl-D-glutamate--2,6-diaminopimelate ligase
MIRTVKCSMILDDCTAISLVAGNADASVRNIEYDSRKAAKDSLFVAVKGFSADGHDFVKTAIDAGASAILVDISRASEFASLPVTVLGAGDPRTALSSVAASFYGHPSKKIKLIGVTGTNGKTSTTYMIESALERAGYKPGVIGTVNYRWAGKLIDAPNTTPESADLQKLFFDMLTDGVDAVVMEVSSHGLDLGRVDDLSFDGAIFTNLTRDHLDFHHDFESYFNAKRKLFSLVRRSGKKDLFAAINADDEYGVRLLADSSSFGYPFIGFGFADGTKYRVDRASVKNSIHGVSYSLISDGSRFEVSLKLAGNFHVYNSLAAFSACKMLGLDARDIIEGLGLLESVAGRFDVIRSKLGFSVVVDYAHTNDALEKLLQSARGLGPARLITVFGCGGDRDKTKRPLMGQVACSLSDHAIITSDNPRSEQPMSIIDDIIAGVGEYKTKYDVEPDREKAIAMAIASAHEGDIVVLAGKGHEDYQIIGKIKIHFDDHEMARKYIAEREAR